MYHDLNVETTTPMTGSGDVPAMYPRFETPVGAGLYTMVLAYAAAVCPDMPEQDIPAVVNPVWYEHCDRPISPSTARLLLDEVKAAVLDAYQNGRRG